MRAAYCRASPMTCGRGWLASRFCWSARLEKDGGSTLHLGRRDVLDPLAHHPLLAEGIAQTTAALTVELVSQREDHLSPGRDRALPRGVDVLPVDDHDR